MAKKQKTETSELKQEAMQEKPTYQKPQEKAPAPIQPALPANVPPEVAEKLKVIQQKLEKFQKSVVEKFDKYIVGIALLPPPQPPSPNLPPDILAEEQKRYTQDKDKYHTLVLIDDSEPTKMTKQELRDKLTSIIVANAKEIDPNIAPQTLLLSELWQNCYDGKYELLQLIGMSAPVYDTGMLGAIRIAELHKSMVLKRFEKYIVAYVLAGSIVRGQATKESDIDVFVVIDDTDVKKMTRAELRDKLRAIIIGMGAEAGELTGIRNKINIQPYILTDFWEMIRESNPVCFTFLRDGVPFFDRGIFMPWKQLLKMGKIKPSAEAIDIFVSSGEQTLERVKFKLRDIAAEDFFWGIHTPTQAALMLHGLAPPAPKETCNVLREVFVKKEKLLEEEYVKMLENVLQTRKDIEHGIKKEVTGKEIDRLLSDSEKYTKRLKKLFTQIEKVKEDEGMVKLHESMQTALRDILTLEGTQIPPAEELALAFEQKLIATGQVPASYLRTLHDLTRAKADYDSGKLSKTEIDKVRRESNELLRFLLDYVQRKRAHEFERSKLRITYGQKQAEITVLDTTAYIIRDLSSPENTIEKATVQQDGSLGSTSTSTVSEFEQSLAQGKPRRIRLREPLFESLQRLFGKDYELAH